MAVRTSAQLKAQFQNRDPQDHTDDMVDTFLSANTQVGTTWYVDPGATVSGDGQAPENAFQTLQEAITAATANNGDMIICMPGTESITQAVTIDKDGIIIVAQNYGGQGNVNYSEWGSYAIIANAAYTNGPGIIWQAQSVSLIGILVASRNTVDAAANAAAGSSAAIVIDDNAGAGEGGNLIHGCRFPRWWANVALVKNIGSSYNQVSSCTFENTGAAGGIGVWYTSGPTHNPTYNRVIDCEFLNMAAAVEYQAGTGSDANKLIRNTAMGCTLFLDTNAQASAPASVAIGNNLDFATFAASFDAVNIAGLQGQGWYYIDNHVRDV